MRARRTILFRLSGLVLAAILIMAILSVAVTFFSPPPFRPPVRTADLLAAFDTPAAPLGMGMRDVRFADMAMLPPPNAGERCDAALSATLAQTIGRTPGDVRLCVSESEHGPRDGAIPRDLRDRFSLAIRQGPQWRVATLPPPPLITRWHVATLGWLTLAGLLLFGLCLLVVRSITRPLQQLAADAREAGIDGPAFRAGPGAPAEVSQLAAAIAGMRRRQAAFVTNRAELLVGIAHDLGTPLTRLAFRIEALPDAARETARADIAEMQKLIAAALEFARGRDRTVEPIALDMLLADRAEVLDAAAAPVRIQSAEPLVVTANLVDLIRVIDNLIVNAQRHGGGAELSLRRIGDAAELVVRDYGPGIDPDAVSRLFDPLYRGGVEYADGRPGIGFGLGLAIVQSNVEAMAGAIRVENHPDGGAVVTLHLPIG
ncbi:MAG: HAMP domain-containing histidine kinase [Sphingomonadales bacterium]|nr:HAMP domain-containing histidine kinase [Sphingomonadales bacterium]